MLSVLSELYMFYTDCAENEISCPNFEFECMSVEHWTRCVRGPRDGQCVAKRLMCDNFDPCQDNHASAGCGEFHAILFLIMSCHTINSINRVNRAINF